MRTFHRLTTVTHAGWIRSFDFASDLAANEAAYADPSSSVHAEDGEIIAIEVVGAPLSISWRNPDYVAATAWPYGLELATSPELPALLVAISTVLEAPGPMARVEAASRLQASVDERHSFPRIAEPT